MPYLYIACFVFGTLLGVRILFFGAERRKPRPDIVPLRWSEPAAVAFLVMFGLIGYLITRFGTFRPTVVAGLASMFALVWAAIVTRLAIATARMTPEVNPDDPRFSLQGHVAIVSAAIEPDGEGTILRQGVAASEPLRARNLGPGGIPVGEEVCIERVENGVAFVEHWSLVEKRL